MDLGTHIIRLFDENFTGVQFSNRSDFGLLTFGPRVFADDDLGFISQPLGDFPQQAVIAPFWSPSFAADDNLTKREFAFQDRDGVPGPDHLVFEWHYGGFLGGDATVQCMIRLNPGQKSSVLTFAYPDITANGEPLDQGAIASVGIRPSPGVGIFGVDLLQISYHDTTNDWVKQGNTLEISKPSSLGGRAFTDTNNNGVQDGAESGLNGRTVFLDLNQNGSLDAGEPSVATDADGWYSFGPLAWGTYHVRMVPGADTFSTPVVCEIELNEQQRRTGIHFGLAGNQLGIPLGKPLEGNIGVPFSEMLQARGGTPPYTWVRLGGDPLPEGMTLSTTGTFSGTPTMNAPYKSTLSLQVTDAANQTATGTMIFRVIDSTIIEIEDWKELNQVSGEPDSSDEDEDGLDLPGEYAYGGTLGGNDADKMPQFTIPANLAVQVVYRRRIANRSFYQLIATDDLTKMWSPAPLLSENTSPLSNGFELVTATLDLDPLLVRDYFFHVALGDEIP